MAAFCETDCMTSPGQYAAGLGLAGAAVGAAGGAAAGAIVGATIPGRVRAPAAPGAARRRGTIGRLSLSGGAALSGGAEAGPAAAADFGATWRRLFAGFEGGAYGLGSGRPWEHAWSAGGVGRADLLGDRVRGYVVAGSGFYAWSYPRTTPTPVRLNLLGYSVGVGVHGAAWRGLGFRLEGRRHDNLSRSGPGAGELASRSVAAGLTYSW